MKSWPTSANSESGVCVVTTPGGFWRDSTIPTRTNRLRRKKSWYDNYARTKPTWNEGYEKRLDEHYRISAYCSVDCFVGGVPTRFSTAADCFSCGVRI